MLNHVNYGKGMIGKYKKTYGTKENKISGFPEINNLEDVWLHLYKIIKKIDQIKKNETKYMNLTKLGDLYIYLNSDKPMEYIPNENIFLE
jgi:hypothetical protein